MVFAGCVFARVRVSTRICTPGTIQYGDNLAAEETIVRFSQRNLYISMFSRRLKKLIRKLPGKRFGEYRLLPIFFIFGAALEYSMIHWQVGEVNFYKTYKHRRVEELVEERLRRELV